MALYGHEIDETTTLLEANLGWICKLDKGDFIGRDALARQKAEGVKRKLVGFEVTDRGIARDDQEVIIDGERVGKVTSGSPAPFLKKNIGFAYVPVEYASVGQQITIDVRGKTGWCANRQDAVLQTGQIETGFARFTGLRMEDPWRTFPKTCTTAKIMNG